MVTANQQLQQITEAEKQLSQVEQQAKSIMQQQVPERKFGTGVTREQQQQVTQRKQQARAAIEQANVERQRLKQARGEILEYQKQKSEAEQAKRDYEVGYKLAVTGKFAGGLKGAALEGYQAGLRSKTSAENIKYNQSKIKELKGQGLEPIYRGGKLVGFEDTVIGMSIGLKELETGYTREISAYQSPKEKFEEQFFGQVQLQEDIKSVQKTSEGITVTTSDIKKITPTKGIIGEGYVGVISQPTKEELSYYKQKKKAQRFEEISKQPTPTTTQRYIQQTTSDISKIINKPFIFKDTEDVKKTEQDFANALKRYAGEKPAKLISGVAVGVIPKNVGELGIDVATIGVGYGVGKTIKIGKTLVPIKLSVELKRGIKAGAFSYYGLKSFGEMASIKDYTQKGETIGSIAKQISLFGIGYSKAVKIKTPKIKDYQPKVIKGKLPNEYKTPLSKTYQEGIYISKKGDKFFTKFEPEKLSKAASSGLRRMKYEQRLEKVRLDYLKKLDVSKYLSKTLEKFKGSAVYKSIQIGRKQPTKEKKGIFYDIDTNYLKSIQRDQLTRLQRGSDLITIDKKGIVKIQTKQPRFKEKKGIKIFRPETPKEKIKIKTFSNPSEDYYKIQQKTKSGQQQLLLEKPKQIQKEIPKQKPIKYKILSDKEIQKYKQGIKTKQIQRTTQSQKQGAQQLFGQSLLQSQLFGFLDKQRFSGLFKQSQQQSQLYRTTQSQLSSQAQAQSFGQKFRIAQPQAQAQAQAISQAQPQAQKYDYKFKQLKIKIPIIEITQTTTPFKFSFRFKKKSKGISQKGYKAFVLKGKKKIYVSKVLPKGIALRKGEEKALKSLRATFGVEEVDKLIRGKDIDFKPRSDIFRSYRIKQGKKIPLKDIYIQKKGKRLATGFETKDIQRYRKSTPKKKRRRK